MADIHAFPCEQLVPNENGYHDQITYFGMSLRDYFAAKAINGVMAEENGATAENIAKWSYNIADAMLAEREKK